jgi:hypothetical protein
VTAQIQRLAPALLTPVVAVAVEPNGGPVLASARSANGALYVIAVNTRVRTARATLTVAGLGGRTLTVVDEGRQVVASGDSFTDTFGPLAARVYVAPPR